MKHKKHLKTLGLLALTCGIFTAGRLTVAKIWGIEYDTRTLEILVVIGVALHLLVPLLLKRLVRTPSTPSPAAALGQSSDGGRSP